MKEASAGSEASLTPATRIAIVLFVISPSDHVSFSEASL
jgi:hypothetical protein